MTTDQPAHRGHGTTAGYPADPKSGDLLLVTREASVQFIEPILFRVIRVCDQPTYDGWRWISGYSLCPDGTAIERREIFVQILGLRRGHLRQPAASR